MFIFDKHLYEGAFIIKRAHSLSVLVDASSMQHRTSSFLESPKVLRAKHQRCTSTQPSDASSMQQCAWHKGQRINMEICHHWVACLSPLSFVPRTLHTVVYEVQKMHHEVHRWFHKRCIRGAQVICPLVIWQRRLGTEPITENDRNILPLAHPWCFCF